ncbi:MAG TPA: glycoside hydrolase 43 family protein [Pyrinomonadaceae bacterium]|nr:glycoside hydrolase 43 family protein [Pyrinomonadaceae bacterium]
MRLVTTAARVLSLVILFLAICQSLLAQSVWTPDNGDGTYKNPIIYADYSDPDVIRVGADFYLTASSFNSAPGLPILHSKDLVNWRIIGHVFEQQIPRDVFSKPQHGNGVWAPAIRYHEQTFYIFYPDPDFGIYLTKAKDPAGPWSTPLLIKQAKGWIDPCPFWDDDGNAYLVHAWANSRAGIKSILTINRLSADGTKILDEGKMVFDGHAHHPTIEGPKLYKRNGYYYIFAPAGGVPTGWQTVLRSRNIYGPYEDKIVMDQGQTKINGPHQGGWVELSSGESWFIHFQDRGPYGRIVHLQPMIWKDDWPVIGNDKDADGKGEPVETYEKPNVGSRYPIEDPQTNDEFSSTLLGLQWQWQANFEDAWESLRLRPGWLRLEAVAVPGDSANLWSVPNLLLQKLPAPQFTVTTKIDAEGLLPGEEAGLVMMGMDYSYLAIRKTPTGFSLTKKVCREAPKGNKEVQEKTIQAVPARVLLRVSVANDALCRFSYSFDGRRFRNLGASFKAREGRWIGAKVGLFALASSNARQNGYADYDWIRFR